jgi:ankyrin repeat protein
MDRTALDWARENGNSEIADLIRARSSGVHVSDHSRKRL